MFKFFRNLLDGVKSSTVQPLIYLMYAGSESWGVYTKRNFAQYSDDAYKRNAVAYAAIQRLARACAYVPIKLRRGPDQVVDEHAVLDLLKRANPWQSGREFIEAAIAYYLLMGNSYIEGIGPEGGAPLELWALRPDRMRVIPSKLGPAGYLYEVNGLKKNWTCDPIEGKSPVLHIKSFNPLDDWYGMSPVEAAAYAIDQHNMAGEWNQSLLQNSARPSGALTYDNVAGGTLSEKQFERLKQEINAAYAGTRNAGRIPILEGGLKWQQMSMSPADMDWINGKNLSAREICLVFGVPPMLLGIPGDNTYSNYQEARQALYEDAALPLLDAFLESLNHWLMPAYGEEGLELFADIDNLPALEPKREKRWLAMQNATWLTINEKRVATGFKPVEDTEADEIFLPSGLVPLKGSLEPPDMGEGLPGEGGAPFGEKPAGEEDLPDDRQGEKPDTGGGKKPDTGGGKKPAPDKKYIWEDYSTKG